MLKPKNGLHLICLINPKNVFNCYAVFEIKTEKRGTSASQPQPSRIEISYGQHVFQPWFIGFKKLNTKYQ